MHFESMNLLISTNNKTNNCDTQLLFIFLFILFFTYLRTTANTSTQNDDLSIDACSKAFRYR